MSMSYINSFSLQQKKDFHFHQSVYQYNKMFYILSKCNFLLPEVTEGIRSKKLLDASNFLKESITCWPWWAGTLEITFSHNLPNSAGTSWQRNSEWLPCDQLEADGFDYFNKTGFKSFAYAVLYCVRQMAAAAAIALQYSHMCILVIDFQWDLM